MGQAKTTTPWAWAKRWLWRGTLLFTGFWLVWLVFVLLGFIPINTSYQPPPGDNRVRLFIRSNEIHTDIVMPVVHEESGIDWRELFPPEDFSWDVRAARYVAVGWGDRGFFVETPTWADLKLSTACYALFWPSETVLHVDYLGQLAPGPYVHEVYITREQYRELAEFVRDSVGEMDARGHAKTASEVTYGDSDRFYVAAGKYHLYNTCNQWTGRGLAHAGLPVGIWTPLKQQVLRWLPEDQPSK